MEVYSNFYCGKTYKITLLIRNSNSTSTQEKYVKLPTVSRCKSKTSGWHNYEISPNPFNENLQIVYELLEDENVVTIEIVDFLGNVVKKIVDKEMQEKGWHNLNVDTQELPYSRYSLRMIVNNSIVNEPIFKL